jgi:hypothetical protein
MKGILTTARVSTAIAILAFASSSNANLIVNGGFENNAVDKGAWAWFSTSDVDGWGGSNVEIWGEGFGNIGAYEGKQHAELNAHPGSGSAFSIFQTFKTQVGQQYNLSFAYGARRNVNEKFRVEVSDLNWVINNDKVNEWSLYDDIFTATTSDTTFRFTSVTPVAGTYGNFLDAVSVTSVPEPGPLALFGLGLAGLGFLKKRKNV